MSRKYIIGVMGPGSKATEEDKKSAYDLGKLIASQDWVLLSGGRNSGVMDAVNKGAKAANGLTIGILPYRDESKISEYVDIPVITDMGNARNSINVLSSDIVVACGTIASGTLSEIALALKSGKNVIVIKNENAEQFLGSIGEDRISFVSTPAEAIESIKTIMSA